MKTTCGYQVGSTLTELPIMVAILGILAAIMPSEDVSGRQR